MSINEINPANSLKTGVDSFTGLPGSISDINRELFGQPLSKAPNSAFGSIPMNSLLESDDRSISAIQTKARSGASSLYGNESGIFQIDRAAQQVAKALMDNTITARVPSGDLVDRTGGYDELLNPNPSNLSATVRSGDTQKELGTGSDWWEVQKADGNGFTERKAYQLPTGKPKDDEPPIRRELKEGDTLWEIAKEELGDGNRWKEFKKGNGRAFTEEEAYKLQLGTKVYRETAQQRKDRLREERREQIRIQEGDKEPTEIGENKKLGDALRDRWIQYFEKCRKEDILKVIKEPRWKEKDETEQVIDLKFPTLFGKNIKSTKNNKEEKYDPAKFRALDIVTISKDKTVTGIEVKLSDQEARKKESRAQEARDIWALGQGGKIRDEKTGELHTPTKVERIVEEEPPDCDDNDHQKKTRKEAAVENVGENPDSNSQKNPAESPNPQPQDYRDPVESPIDVERPNPNPRNNINRLPPRFNVPARPPVGNVEPPGEPPKTNPPATKPPIDDAPPARPPGPPARPRVSTTLLSGLSKLARPLGVVTDVIDLNNAYNEDGGFGENFQETAGGIAGGWAGAAAGAAIGTAVIPIPVVGTVLGGIAGGIIGSGAGEGIVKGVRDFFG